MARIFVFIPAFNAAKFIARTIEAVRAQTYSDWEMLIIDDASVDDTVSVCRQVIGADRRIKLVQNEVNLGMVSNWNKGISFCQSEYFIKLDADDVWRPTMLERSVTVMDAMPNVALIFSRYVNIDGAGQEIPGSEIELPEFAKNRAFSCVPLVKMGEAKMLQYPVLRQGLSLMRTAAFKKVGVYRYLATKATQAASDTEFYFRVGCNFDIFCIDEVLYEYRVHDYSISAEDKKKSLQEQKLFEVKSAINDYYREEGKIGFREWRGNKKAIDFRHSLFMNYQARRDRQPGVFFQTCAELLFLYPIKTIRHILTKISVQLI